MPTSSKMRYQTGRSELGNDGYLISHHDIPDRAPRSLSPRKVDGSRRFLDGNRITDSTDRRNYGFCMGGGRSEGSHSNSPQHRLLHKMDQYEDEVAKRKYGYPEDGDFDGANSRLKNLYVYNHSTSRAGKERDYGKNRFVDIDSHGILNKKSIPLEEDTIRGLYHLPRDISPTKDYVEIGGNSPLSPGSMDVGGIEHERLQYQQQPISSDKLEAMESYKEEKHRYYSRDRQPVPSDKIAAMESYKEEKHGYRSRNRQPIPSDKLAAVQAYEEEKYGYCSRDRQPIPTGKLVPMESYKEDKPVYHSRDKLPAMESYREGDKPVYHSRDKAVVLGSYREGEKPIYHRRDILYTTMPASHSKDILSTSQHNDFVSASTVGKMSEFSVSYGDGETLPASEGYSKSSVQLTEPIGFSSYGQRSHGDTPRDAEAEPRNLIYNKHGACGSSRTGREDFVYTKTTAISSDDREHLSDDVHRLISPHIHDYNHAPMDYDLRDFSRSGNMLSVLGGIDNSEHSRGRLRKSNVQDHPTLQKQTDSDYLDTSRKSYALKRGGEYLISASNRAEFEKRMPRDYGVPQDHQISYMRSEYGYGRDLDQVVRKEGYQSICNPLHDAEAQKFSVRLRTHRIEEELGVHEQSEKVLKRKNLDDDINQHDSRTITSRKCHVPEEFEDHYDSDECFDEGMSAIRWSKTRRFDPNEYRKGERACDGQEKYRNFASGDRFLTRGSLLHSPGSSIRYYKNSGKYVKANPRLGSLSRHNLNHVDRTGLNKQHKVWKRIEDYNEDVHENDGNTSEEWSHHAESEPSEDTEEFKEMVQEALLLYSKKLNVNPSIRRRYKEQRKAVFCIACGRSLSKEFMNTQRLVRHAFMSHKVGLRALHLGLQKAICVLMGWNSVVPQDVITWMPEVLHDAEAMAQKEDLIIWPPVVVIRNISMSSKNPKEQKVVPIEGVEAFLRGKGFVGGKINVCLGRPADQSVMVVKFLGTFTGLGNAEKLHKFFFEHKRGRAEFSRLTSSNSRSSSNNIAESEMQRDKLEEQLLYGYMGISEDLDSVDFNTKKYCFIKSKKEILDLANAPVKPGEM